VLAIGLRVVVAIDLLLRRGLKRAEVDRAVFFALLQRVRLVLAGPFTIVLIARCLTPQIQGFYYTFASLLALQSCFELGFFNVIISVASHEWSHLKLNADGDIEGDEAALSRLISLGRLIFKWYAVASILFVVSASIIGCVFFSLSDYPNVRWWGPWLVAVGLTGLLFWTLPFNSLLEGCNQVSAVNQFRLIQATAGCLVLWASLFLGWGLWAVVATVGTRFVCDLYLLLVRYHRFFKPFFRRPIGLRMCWRTEIWPMQWRLALSGMSNYFGITLGG